MKKILLFVAAAFCCLQSLTAQTITLTEPGTLSEKLSEINQSEAVSITVKGPMGGGDLKALRDLGRGSDKLQTIDLSEATLVNDGNGYYTYSDYDYGLGGVVIGGGSGTYYISDTGRNYYNRLQIGTTVKLSYYHVDLPYAFSGMISVQTIKLPKGMTGIGSYCFVNCPALTNVVPAEELTHVAKDAFAATALFTNARAAAQNGVAYWNGVALDVITEKFANANTPLTIKSGTTIIADNLTKDIAANVGTLSLPSTVKIIGISAFSDCANLTLSTLPADIQYIHENAFYNCTALANTSFTIPAGIRELGNNALSSAKSVTFEGTSNMTYIHEYSIPTTCPNKETIDGVTYINNIAFQSGKTSQTEVWLRDGTTLIGSGFLRGSDNLEGANKLHLPKSVKRINEEAACNAWSHTNMTLPTNIRDIYIHSETPVIIDAPYTGAYNRKVHLRPSAETEWKTWGGAWKYSKESKLVFDLIDSELGGEVDGGGESGGGDTGGETTPEGIANTPATAYTAGEAINLIYSDNDLTPSVYVKGRISKIDEVSVQHGNATYYIQDDSDSIVVELKVFRGKYLGGAKFTSEDQIKVGDDVIVYGNLILYKDTPEINTGSSIYSLNGRTDIRLITVDKAASLKGKPVYDLIGRRITGTPKRGIYIVEGKKVVL